MRTRIFTCMLMASITPFGPAVAQVPAPTAYFTGERLTISESIAQQCVADQRDVDRRDDRNVVCSKPVGGLKGSWLKFGPGHTALDNAARQRLRFTLLSRHGLIEVRAEQDIGPGMKQQPWKPRDADAVNALLARAGGAREPISSASTQAEVATSGVMIVPATPR